MKLVEAVKMGRFCGLETVEECIENIIIHQSMFSYKDFPDMLKELEKEYMLYKEGKITLDFKAIDEENDLELDKFFEEQSKLPKEVIDYDF